MQEKEKKTSDWTFRLPKREGPLEHLERPPKKPRLQRCRAKTYIAYILLVRYLKE